MQTRRGQEPHHLIDFLFPAALLFVFAFSAVSVILLATGIYRDTVNHSSRSYTAQTALAYLTEKVHQNDGNGTIEAGTFEGCPALIFRQSYHDSDYSTYIYAYGQELRELFVKDGTPAELSDGKAILEIRDLEVSDLGDGLFVFSCTDTDGHTVRAVVHSRSQTATTASAETDLAGKGGEDG